MNEAQHQRGFTPHHSHREIEFLEGSHSWFTELRFLLRIISQFFYGLRKLHFLGPCVTFFGSARYDEHHQYYQLARHMATAVSRLGFTVITGGGPGIMEAANRGAREAGGRSVGCNIQLLKGQNPNAYLDNWITLDYFFIRKTLLSKYSYAFVVMPGGYGTLDEFFEAITLIQTGKFQRFPVVLMGKDYHQHLIAHLKFMVEQKTIDAADLELFLCTDSLSEAVQHIEKYAINKFNLRKNERESEVSDKK
ncbi:MAG: TIGR00730 family Rossman fold protein [Chitinophagales bacterium]